MDIRIDHARTSDRLNREPAEKVNWPEPPGMLGDIVRRIKRSQIAKTGDMVSTPEFRRNHAPLWR